MHMGGVHMLHNASPSLAWVVSEGASRGGARNSHDCCACVGGQVAALWLRHSSMRLRLPCRDTCVLGSFRDYVYMVHLQHNCVGGVPTVQLPGLWHLQMRLVSDYCLVWLVKEPLYILRDTFVRQNPILSFVKFAGCAGNARSVPQHPVLGTTVTYSWGEILRHYEPG